ELSPAERAMHVGRRKEIYETLHPETKQGGSGRGRKKSGQIGHPNERFTKDVAKKTDQSERKVRRDATRAKNVKVLDQIAGTCLDEGVQLDALAKLSPDEQQKLADQAKAGERVNAKAHVKKVIRAKRELALGEKLCALPDVPIAVFVEDFEWDHRVYS